MNKLVVFLQNLVIKGWKFWHEDTRLRYRAPKEGSEHAILAQLKQYKAEILHLLQECPDIFNVYPLCYGQRALWFLWQLAPESHAYNVLFSVRICSVVDMTAMSMAFAALRERHPILRTSFPKLGSEPIQQVHQNQELDWLQIDASGWSEEELKAKVIEAHQIPFDLETGPIMRVRCFSCSEVDHILLVSIHHIACDYWSLDILVQELSKLYQAQQASVEISLPTLKHSYFDYVSWQWKILCGTTGEKLWNYWQHQLAGDLPVLNLPTDRQRSPIQTYNGASHKFKLSSQLTEQLKELAQEKGVTFYTILLSAFKVFLYRYTGQEDILVGSPTSGRTQSEFAPIFGYFVDPVVLRTNLANNPSFNEFLTQVRQTVLEALTHQDYPFALLVEKLQPHRDPSRSPIFQASFALQQLQQSQDILLLLENETQKDVDWGGMKLRPFEIPQQEGQFDLDLEMVEGSSSVFGTFKYNTDLFDGSTIERMAAHFQNLCSAIVENPEASVGELPLLSEAERHQLLREWNDTATEYPTDKCIHQLFEKQVEKTPLSVAVVFDTEQLTYQQLNQRANQLAHHLQSKGVGPEVLVGICVERSIEMVVGLLGILKAGGAYVPLDPNYPLERLSYMLADSQLPILLTQQHLVKQLPQHQTQTICLDVDWQKFADYSQDNPCREVKSDNLAYIIYTSGSTGNPKGTMILHRGMVNYLSWCTKAYNVAEGEGSTVNSSISFDATITSLFSPLLVGRKVVLLPEKREIEALKAALCSGTKFSLVKITPAHLKILSHLFASEQVNIQTQAFIIGGEALSEKITSFWQNHAAATRLINEYGPTETVVGCCIYEVGKQIFPGGDIPIGRPISNTQIYILDSHLQPVPVGVAGELYIGGDGLARGYLNRPELTQEKFIQNPFSDSKSERLYKTGDLARYSSDGNITFIGRIDQQVKVRGFRIEPGEIEAVLNTHPQIEQAVVVATEDIPGDKRLVAYVVSCNESLTTNQLRELLIQKLPEYMVPNAFVTLDTLPLTPNGKVDRLALPTLDGEITREHEYVAPRTPTEEIIANIFAVVLGVQNVGIYDNFFTLGGHSLLATQLISRLRVVFEVEIPLRAIFESPTVAQLDQTITLVRQNHRRLSLPPIQPLTHNLQIPLSWAQERLWFLNQLEGASSTYNMSGAIRFTGQLDISAFQQTSSEIVRRHSILRTSFQSLNGTPIQVIHPEATMNIKVVDLQQHSATERETLLYQQAQTEAITPFNLEIAPLIRCSLLQLDATEYVLLLSIHHIVSDGWSMGVFIQELSSLYPAFCVGVPSPLPELPIQYADFAVWQRQSLSGDVLQNQLNYWREQLDGAPELLQLPTDRTRPKVQTYRGTTQSWTLNTDLTQKLQTLSRQSGTTLFMTLLTAFATLLYRYSGQSDILIGSPIANRNRSEIESLIGFFVNTLVLRTRFEANPSFEKLLAQMRETTLQAYEHQDVPFEQVVEALQPERSLSHSPLFQVMFVWQNAPSGELELPGVTLSEFNQQSAIAKFDLTVFFTETLQGLEGSWEYNTDLFDGSTIERMAAHFQNLCSAIVENPEASVGELPLLSEAERHQLLREWNDTATEYPTDKCIHQLFEKQVEKTPLSVAVVFDTEQLTYQQLNQRANQLAHHLQSKGVGPEVLVGICVERSIEMVVGLLGILKAGGAYVPIDPSYPQERIDYMLVDSAVPVLLTQEKLLERIYTYNKRVICLNRDWQEIATEKETNLPTQVKQENLAYIIYTSGSTGKPKGVMNTHRGICNRLLWMVKEYQLTESDRVLQKTPFSFDVSVWEFFSTLMTGATLVVAKPEGHQDISYLVDLIAQKQITTLHFVPSMLQVFLEAERIEECCGSLKRVICSGEVLPFTLQQRFFSRLNCELHNLYGPTEAAIDVTYWQCQPQSELAKVPIGRPIANTQIYILDSHLQPAPIGVAQELHIGGVGVARGYLNRPELTEQNFIPNPFSSDPESRLYKTGDLARFLSDGQIEYLGRIDYQVKVRGFRIELGEIEAIMAQHSAVKEAVAIAREDTPGEKTLVGYFVPDVEDGNVANHQISELRKFLKERLPDYMVPNAFVMLESLPLTPNGKINRKALPAPTLEDLSTDEFISPQTPTQSLIANTFAAVLNLPDVSINHNFFELGGHSILATQVISRLNQTFERELPLRILFEYPTVAQLEQAISKQNLSSLNAPAIIPTSREGQIPLSWAQERLWFLNQLQPSAVYNIHGSLRFSGSLNVNALHEALQVILRRHEALRTNFPTVDGNPVQVIDPKGTITLTYLYWQALSEAEQHAQLQNFAWQEAQTPFDLANDALWRLTLVQLAPTEAVLVITVHHIVADGWSLGVFLQELLTVYKSEVRNDSSALPPLPIQYADFSVWQRQWLQGEVLETQLSYWKQQLTGTPSILQLPTDRLRPTVQTYRGQSLTFVLPPELVEQLKHLCRKTNTTLFMILLGAFATLLYRYSGQSDILIGSPIANRNRAELESLIGMFVNTLVLRMSFERDPCFTELLRQVRKMTLEAYAHQDVPFEQVVEAVQPERNLSHSPLFQVMFVLQNAPMVLPDLPELDLKLMPATTGTAKFDLTLFMEEVETGLIGTWEYNSDLFEPETIVRMTGHFQTLLEGIVANPEQLVAQLPLLTEAERQQLLVEWNDTATNYSQDKCIHQLFEMQVEQTPNAVALVFEDQQLTYRELNQRANQVAHYLQQLGVKPEVLVGICVERSIEMVVGILGIFKAGGAYIPLDPSYPKERLALMLEDSQPLVLLTQKALVKSLPDHQAHVVCVDFDWKVIARQNQDNLLSSVTVENLAYVIYTSGSTGHPKGVAIKHQSPVCLCHWAKEAFTTSELSGVLAATSICFDLSVFELFVPLCVGGKIIVAQNALDILNLNTAEEITLINTVPSAIAELLRIGGIPAQVQTVNLAGEPLQNQIVELLYQHQNIERVYNLYGPSEDTTYSTKALVGKGTTKPPSIGRPISNTQIYILDSHLEPVPIGVAGELYIGGDGLARGYLNRSELTQEKFIQNPFCDSKSERLYKTGDLARYSSDGNITFIGRIDQQVKVRGFRIEPGEIEAVLNTHPQIEQAVVIATEDIPGNKQLVAYIASNSVSLDSFDLRDFLRLKMPNYMIPNAFVVIESLPLMPNGKIDRKALPAPELQRIDRKNSFIKPKTDLEEIISQIWQDILGFDQVSIHDNFFDLGGHSLLITKVQSQLSEQLNQEISLLELFKFPTISTLAQHLNKSNNKIKPENLEDNRSQKRISRQSEKQQRRLSRQNRRIEKL